MTTPVIYLAQTHHHHEGTVPHGVAFTAEAARELAESTLTDRERAMRGPWTEPDLDGEQCAALTPSTLLEVVVVPLVGAAVEWRVTGEPGGTYPSYFHTWTDASVTRHGEKYGDTPEKCARGFAAMVRAHANQWDDGPHVSSRVVGASDWTVSES